MEYMSCTNANFVMFGILLGQESRKRKNPQEKIVIIQQTMDPGMIVSHIACLHYIAPATSLNSHEFNRHFRLI